MDRFRRSLRRRRLIAWIAMLAVWGQALVPVYAMALGDGGRGGAIPVCTGAGIVWQIPGDRGQADKPGSGTASAFCPYCLVFAASFTAPITPAVLRTSAPAVRIDRVVERDSIVTPRRFVPHLSRAPPLSA
jgi:hypothetical protein